MTTARIVTFGCKTNQYEGDALASALAKAGVRVDEAAQPDIVIVNSCTVTEKADRRARQAVMRIAREHPAARIYITGCYAAREADQLRRLPNVAGVFADKTELARIITRGKEPAASVEPPAGRRGRAYLKIQDGCDARCSYCIVPLVRPALSSKPLDAILIEARELVAAGFLEIVLTGIHVGKYSGSLAKVISGVAATPGLARLRLSSIEMPELAEEIIELMASNPVVCPHVHLPLQSGDSGILAAMNRRYSPGQFLDAVGRIRERIPDAAVTTDVIVGFPGESDSAFENTLRVVREARFSKVHVFRFSARAGTKAATLPGHVTQRVVTRRKRQLMTLADELALDYARAFVGRNVEVIVETVEPGKSGRAVARTVASGLTERYLRVTFDAGPELIGRKALVTIERAGAGTLEGRLKGKDSQ